MERTLLGPIDGPSPYLRLESVSVFRLNPIDGAISYLRMEFVSVFRWSVLSWAQSMELVPVSGQEIFGRWITNSVALFRELTKPTERPPLVGKVSANFSG
jgi:hypothetical protein